MNYLRNFVLSFVLFCQFLFPAIGLAERPSPGGEVAILIDIQKRNLTILDNHKVHKTYKIAVGKLESPTPVGNWEVIRLAKNWGSGFGSRFMLLNVPWGLYGIHGTNKPYSIGGYESHGCIRMFNQDVEEIYPWIKIGTPVIVVGNPFGALNQPWRTAFKGHNGSDIVIIQQRLQYWGLYQGKCDGIFGWSTETAVKEFQKRYKLPQTGQLDEDDYNALGL